MHKREGDIDDPMQKFVVIGVEIAILTIICVSLFSGGPAFKTSATIQPHIALGPESSHRVFANLI
jgi:hypothetical protein